jgi:hypothetical protein
LYKFPFAQDQHGGTETYLWPYGGISTRPVDEAWYRCIINRFVTQIHNDCRADAPSYMTSCGGDGMGNIFSELYECHGIRCDFNDYYGNGKSITLESSITKLLAASQLANHWKWCKEALTQSIEILYKEGLSGFVKDSLTGLGIFGVSVARNGDWTQNWVLTDSVGRYVKYMNDGTYTITFTHPDYVTRTITGVVNACGQRHYANIKMMPKVGITTRTNAVDNRVIITALKNGIRIQGRMLDNSAKILICDVSGRSVQMVPVTAPSIALWDGTDKSGRLVSNGCYVVKIQNRGETILKNFMVSR